MAVERQDYYSDEEYQHSLRWEQEIEVQYQAELNERARQAQEEDNCSGCEASERCSGDK